jgi:MOSC domain-containing protein YiiM
MDSGNDMDPTSSLNRLLDNFPYNGCVEWIGLRPARRQPMEVVTRVQARVGEGLLGDRFKGKGKRQITLIQHEHLSAIAALLDRGAIEPATLRRNIVVAGINLLALKGKRFYVGDALLETSGLCHPCSRMEMALGAGGYNAMRGHGGITARVIVSGELCIGDPVRVA